MSRSNKDTPILQKLYNRSVYLLHEDFFSRYNADLFFAYIDIRPKHNVNHYTIKISPCQPVRRFPGIYPATKQETKEEKKLFPLVN